MIAFDDSTNRLPTNDVRVQSLGLFKNYSLIKGVANGSPLLVVCYLGQPILVTSFESAAQQIILSI